MSVVPNERAGPFDLVVVGGGLAGVCAALSAARQGLSVALVHGRPVLGGNSSTEVRVPPRGAGYHNPWAHETGIVLELLLRERARCHERAGYGMANAQWDLTLYETVRQEERIELYLNTLVVETEMEADDRIAAVVGVQSGTERVIRFEGRLFADCSGDGYVGVAAGVPWVVGQEPRSKYGESLAPEVPQPHWRLGSSLIFRARDAGRPVPFTPPPWAVPYRDEASLRHRPHEHIEGGYWWIEIEVPFNLEKGILDDDVYDELLAHLLGIWDHIKNHCVNKVKAQNFALDWVGATPGRRESRRFIGAHVMTQGEIVSGHLFPDRVAYGGWVVDDHTRGGIKAKEKAPSFDKSDVDQDRCLVAPYSIPLSSMYAPRVRNLFFAGRVMSASRVVFNSLRVQQTLAVCGQAVGTAAAVCRQMGVDPGELGANGIESVQQRLLRQDCYIPGVRNRDPEDLARNGRVTATSEATYRPKLSEDWVSLDVARAQLVPVTAGRIDRVRLYLHNATSSDKTLKVSVHPAQDIWDLAGLDRHPFVTTDVPVPAGHQGWLDAPVDVKVDGPSLVWLALAAAPGIKWRRQRETPPGFSCADHSRSRWWFGPKLFGDWEGLAADVVPESRPFPAEAVINGVNRPETWPNLWMSENGLPLPQWLEVTLARPSVLSRVELVFDTNTSRGYENTPGLFRSPECVRDCTISVFDGRKWRDVASLTDNYQRLAVVTFEPVRAERVRVTVTRTNGAGEARIFSLRIYA